MNQQPDVEVPQEAYRAGSSASRRWRKYEGPDRDRGLPAAIIRGAYPALRAAIRAAIEGEIRERLLSDEARQAALDALNALPNTGFQRSFDAALDAAVAFALASDTQPAATQGENDA
jgi:hypothetical protein